MSDIKKKCVTCTKNGGILKCNGCDQVFCNTHAIEHRQNLAIDLDYIIQENDSIQHEIQQMSTDHALFKQIDKWEKDSITKIQTAATTARKALEKLINQSKENLSKACHDLGVDLISSLNTEDYLETDLDHWTEKLNRLKSEIIWPSSINIIENKRPGVHLIRVENSELSKNELISKKQQLPPPVPQQQLSSPVPQQQKLLPPQEQQLPTPVPQQQLPSIVSPQQQLSPVQQHLPSATSSKQQQNEQEQKPLAPIKLPKKIQDTFLDVYGPGRLEKEKRLARHIGNIDEYSCIRGNLLYCEGRNSIIIRIEKCKKPYNIFVGCISSTTTIKENILKLPSVLGWYGFDRVYTHGVCFDKRKKYQYKKSFIKENHVLRLTFDCNKPEIILYNETVKQEDTIPVEIDHAPLPWQLLVVMNKMNDRVRILDNL